LLKYLIVVLFEISIATNVATPSAIPNIVKIVLAL
jgi:hypothetical protein